MGAKFEFDKMYCGHVKRGDIMVAVEGGKEEIVIIVQENILNERLSTILGVPVEPHTAAKTIYKNELLLKASEVSLGQHGVCRPHQMRPYDRRWLVAKKGELNPERLRELYEKIDMNLGRFRDK